MFLSGARAGTKVKHGVGPAPALLPCFTTTSISCSVHFQVTFINPAIERRSKLQRQRRIFPKEKGRDISSFCFASFFLHSWVNLHNVNNYANNIFILFFFSVHVGKDFLRAAQMNMNFATWGRLMMSILPPCSSLEPLSPPLPGTNAGAVSSITCQSR